MRTWVAQALMPIVCALALLLGVIALGRATCAALHDRDAYTIALTDIDCDPPEGLSRGDFLTEVRHLSGLPDRLHLLDDDLPDQLARAFAVHPWVESVQGVQVRNRQSATGPPRSSVRVELVHRRAVLAVCLSGDKIPRDGSTLLETWSGMSRNALVPCRAVDRRGVLLPVTAGLSHLPVLTTEVAAPAGPPGTPWDDRRIVAAAATVGFLEPHLDQLHVRDCDIEIVQGNVIFRKRGVRILWGHAPGREKTGEVSAAVKLQRLLDYQAAHDGLEGLEHDVRLLAHQGHFPLSPDVQP